MHHPIDRIVHTTAFVTPVVEHWLEREIAQRVHPMKDRSDDPSHHERTLYLWATSRSLKLLQLLTWANKLTLGFFNRSLMLLNCFKITIAPFLPSRPETLYWVVASLWSPGGRAWTLSGYGHVNSSAPHPHPPPLLQHWNIKSRLW